MTFNRPYKRSQPYSQAEDCLWTNAILACRSGLVALRGARALNQAVIRAREFPFAGAAPPLEQEPGQRGS